MRTGQSYLDGLCCVVAAILRLTVLKLVERSGFKSGSLIDTVDVSDHDAEPPFS